MTVQEYRKSISSSLARMGSIWLIRHGETEWNRDGRLNSHTDIPLSTKGQELTKRHRMGYRAMSPEDSILVSSDLKRSWQTAKTLFPSKKIWRDARLNELNFGMFEGHTSSELYKSDNAYIFRAWRQTATATPENQTECPISALARLSALFEDLAYEEKPVIAVFHGVLIRLLVSALLSEKPEDFWNYSIDNCHYATFFHRDGRLVLSQFNCLPAKEVES